MSVYYCKCNLSDPTKIWLHFVRIRGSTDAECLVLWVSPLRRGSSEGCSTATLTHPSH